MRQGQCSWAHMFTGQTLSGRQRACVLDNNPTVPENPHEANSSKEILDEVNIVTFYLLVQISVYNVLYA